MIARDTHARMGGATCDCSQSREPPPSAEATNALCPSRTPPRVAICVVGGARTFPQPQAWRSLKRNLVEAFGGIGLAPHSLAPDVFLHLKLLDDAPKTHREWKFDSLSPAGAAVCAASCAFRPAGLVLMSNSSHAGPAHPGALKNGCFRNGFFGHTENLLRAVSQWSSFSACHADVERMEAANGGRQYDLVALTRPDTVWYTAVKPFCQLPDWRETTIVHRGPVRWNSTLEWLLLMPRRHARNVLTTASIFDSCKKGEACCGIERSEDLLAHALRHGAGRWRQQPFGVDILRGAQHAKMRNAGCAQPDIMGFASFEHCRSVVYGLPMAPEAERAAKAAVAGHPAVAPAHPRVATPPRRPTSSHHSHGHRAPTPGVYQRG